MDLESIMLSERSLRKTNTYDLTHILNLKVKTNKQNKTNWFIDIENKLKIVQQCGFEGMDEKGEGD